MLLAGVWGCAPPTRIEGRLENAVFDEVVVGPLSPRAHMTADLILLAPGRGGEPATRVWLMAISPADNFNNLPAEVVSDVDLKTLFPITVFPGTSVSIPLSLTISQPNAQWCQPAAYFMIATIYDEYADVFSDLQSLTPVSLAANACP